jgi:hypothetical protein
MARFTPDVPGRYVLELKVTDGTGADLSSVTIDAFSGQVPPNANAGTDASLNACPLPRIDLDGRASNEPGNPTANLRYQWRLVGRPPMSQRGSLDIDRPATSTPSLTPDAQGAYVVGLRAANAAGRDYDQVLVSVRGCGDSDADGLIDAVETATGTFVSATNTGTSPTDSDSDDDGLTDGFEVITSLTNPVRADTDGDGAADGAEITAGSNPLVPDQPLATGTYREGGGTATSADIFSFRNVGTTNITSILVDLGPSANRAIFDTNTSTGRRFSATTTGVGFSGTFTLSNGNRAVRMNFTDFQPGETFTLNVDVDDATAGTATTGAEMAGAIVTVTSGRGNDSGVFAAVPGVVNDAAVTVRDAP